MTERLTETERKMVDGALDVAVQLATSEHEQQKILGQIIGGLCAIVRRVSADGTDIKNSDQFVVHRLRSKPVEYTVAIRHFVIGGQWQMGVTVQDVSEDDTNRERVAADLRRAAEILDAGP